MEIQVPSADPLRDPPGTDAARPIVAIIDSDPEVCNWLQAKLEPADCRCDVIDLAGYTNGQLAFAALLHRGARLMVYDIGPFYRRNRSQVVELAEASMDAGIPLIVSDVQRWMAEEQQAMPGKTRSEYLAAAGSRVLREVRRLLSGGVGSTELQLSPP